MKRNHIIFLGSLFGFLSVAMGAFGAHALKESLTPELTDTYKTGILYLMIHSVVLLGVGLAGIEKYFKSSYFFLSGILLFSISLILYSVTGIKTFAMFAPFGGASFMIGWILIMVSSLKKDI